jgi:GT2 family glycosyltransferase
MPKENKNPISIILPVYEGLDETIACIESVLSHTEGEYRLILIDDCSPAKAVWPTLRSYADTHEHIEAYHNAENLSWSGSINKGIQLAAADVILLNSDTLVTPGWLNKLREAAYSRPNVASVTPLSNSAGPFSVPVKGGGNIIPPELSINDIAALIEKYSPRLRPLVPTGHGFCMLVTRQCLDNVGLMDESKFPRGYGAEVDFCLRASQKGFVHLIDDQTYIYHHQGISYKEKRNPYIEEANAIIKKNYPNYKKALKHWHCNDELDGFRTLLADVLTNHSSNGEHSSVWNAGNYGINEGKKKPKSLLHAWNIITSKLINIK